MCSLEPDHIICQDQLLSVLVISLYIMAVTDFMVYLFYRLLPPLSPAPFYVSPGPTRKQMAYPEWVISDDSAMAYKGVGEQAVGRTRVRPCPLGY